MFLRCPHDVVLVCSEEFIWMYLALPYYRSCQTSFIITVMLVVVANGFPTGFTGRG